VPHASAREQLLRFIDDRIFRPALDVQPLAFGTPEDRKLLRSVQKRVHESRQRYLADYESAVDIKVNFVQDLTSKAGQALATDMWLLKLTRFEDVSTEFLRLCKQLGL
jgi:hypothetical protein